MKQFVKSTQTKWKKTKNYTTIVIHGQNIIQGLVTWFSVNKMFKKFFSITILFFPIDRDVRSWRNSVFKCLLFESSVKSTKAMFPECIYAYRHAVACQFYLSNGYQQVKNFYPSTITANFPSRWRKTFPSASEVARLEK